MTGNKKNHFPYRGSNCKKLPEGNVWRHKVLLNDNKFDIKDISLICLQEKLCKWIIILRNLLQFGFSFFFTLNKVFYSILLFVIQNGCVYVLILFSNYKCRYNKSLCIAHCG